MTTSVRRALAATAVLAVPAIVVGGGEAFSSTGARHDRPVAPGPNSGAVRVWNAHAADALTNPPTAPVPGAGMAPTVGGIHLAMVQAAVYDAVNSIDGGHEPYLTGLPPASANASMDAAVATAAHHVLVEMTPLLPAGVRANVDNLYLTYMATIPDGASEDAGVEAGLAAATAMLRERDDDGRYSSFSFSTGTGVGQWRPTPPTFVNDPFAWVAKVDPFVVEDAAQFRTRGPAAVTSGTYTKDYNEVKALGAVDSARTPEQTALATFYTVNPVPLFNRSLRAISISQGLSLVDDARLFAMANLSAADSFITCWADKEYWSYWRPVTAIHEGDSDGNPHTVGDPGWTPLLPTPPYPDHPSGFNCASSGYMYGAKAFFGRDQMAFDVVRIAPPAADVTRHYTRFTDVVDDTIDARVYLGIHFRTADVQAARIGKDVAHWLDHHYFAPVR